MKHSDPSTGEVQSQLNKILSSTALGKSRSLCRLLKYCVDAMCNGEGQVLKEYVLGTDVFDRGVDFDCRIDPIVRVQVRNLRRRLSAYYAKEGATDPVLVEMPVGTYTPTFRYAHQRSPIARSTDLSLKTTSAATSDCTVGRDDDLTDLRSAISDAREGYGSLILVCGEAGIGKTTLVRTALAEATITNTMGLCSERLAGAEAYLPILEAIENLMRRNPIAVMLLRDLAPTWYVQLFPYSVNDPLCGSVLAAARNAPPQRLKREFLGFLHEFTQSHALAMFIDDVHWADPSTLDLITWTAGRCGSERLLLLAAYRPSELLESNSAGMRALCDLQTKDCARELRPALLKRADIEEYVRRKYSPHRFPSDFISFLSDRTEGNPLFLTELLNELSNREYTVRDEQGWRINETFERLEPSFPVTIRSTIDRAILRLSEEDRELLKFAAVQGNEFDSVVVAHAADMNVESVEERLRAIELNRGLIRCLNDGILPDGALSSQYVFVHVLYQNALFQSLPLAQRTRLCLAVAESIRASHSAQINGVSARLAYLFDIARDFARAAKFFLLAAQTGIDRSLHREAATLAGRGLNALHQSQSIDRSLCQSLELDFELVLGRCCMSARGFGSDEARSHYTRAIALAEVVGDNAKHVGARRGLLAYYLAQAKYTQAEEESRLLYDLARATDDKPLLVEACYGISFTLSQRGYFKDALPLQRNAIELHEQCSPGRREFVFALDPGVGCRLQQAMNVWILGEPDSGLELCHQALALAQSRNDFYGAGFSLMYTAVLHELRYSPEQTKAKADEAIRLAEEHGFTEILGWALLERGWAICQLGDHERGIATIRQVLAAQQARGSRVARPHFLASLSECLSHVHRYDEALDAAQEGLAASVTTGARYFEAELHRLSGVAYLGRGERTLAVDDFMAALACARMQAAKSWEVRILTSLVEFRLDSPSCEYLRDLRTLLRDWNEGKQTGDLQRAYAMAGVSATAGDDVTHIAFNGRAEQDCLTIPQLHPASCSGPQGLVDNAPGRSTREGTE